MTSHCRVWLRNELMLVRRVDAGLSVILFHSVCCPADVCHTVVLRCDAGNDGRSTPMAGDTKAASQAADADRAQLASARAQGLLGCLDCWRFQVLLQPSFSF